jgi:hypothetical protein
VKGKQENGGVTSKRRLTAEHRLARAVDCVRKVMTHAQKPDLVFQRNGRVHLNRPGGGGGQFSGFPDEAVHIQTPGKYPEENIPYLQYGESLKTTRK